MPWSNFSKKKEESLEELLKETFSRLYDRITGAVSEGIHGVVLEGIYRRHFKVILGQIY